MGRDSYVLVDGHIGETENYIIISLKEDYDRETFPNFMVDIGRDFDLLRFIGYSYGRNRLALFGGTLG